MRRGGKRVGKRVRQGWLDQGIQRHRNGKLGEAAVSRLCEFATRNF